MHPQRNQRKNKRRERKPEKIGKNKRYYEKIRAADFVKDEK